MPELVRSIASRLREFVGNRRRAQRYRAQLPLSVSLQRTNAGNSGKGSARVPSLAGHTRDISSSGLALVVPAIRIGDRYLTGEDRKLHIQLELPDGIAHLQAVPVRYEQLEREGIETGYLIGVKITEISDADRARLNQYVQTLLK